jgi:diaminohydroxyphosphoribosylaminopyrimidine deaminase/5-amino-6-(5-phosphoribosylamino)uracil reductase
MSEALDRRFMAAAIRLGRGALGTTWPNPAVGAILVKDGRVVGRGRTARGGRPHGEPLALAMAGGEARGATLYVSLEPCAHQGKAPPCADAVVAAGVSRVVAPIADPDARVAGSGFARLRAAGVEVVTGLLADAARRANAGHIKRMGWPIPHVTLKLAVSADDAIGRVGEAGAAVTGAIARRHAQALRSRFDAILVGRGTVAADDPQLTCRLPGLEDRSPVRIVLDSDGRLARSRRVFHGGVPTWVLTADDKAQSDDHDESLTSPLRGGRNLQAESAADFGRGARPLDSAPPSRNSKPRREATRRANFDLPSRGRLSEPAGSEDSQLRVLPVSHGERGLDLHAGLERLGQEGITRVLVEGGARVARALLEADLVDEALLFRSPHRLGGELVPALAGLPLSAIEHSERFRRIDRRRLGDDILSRYEQTG